MDIKKIPFCKRVIFWGQYGQTCWFNALLMAVLYSQRSRNVVYQQSKHWDTRIQLFRLLKYVLKYKYIKTKNPQKDYEFFNAMRPEVVLEMLTNTKKGKKYLPKHKENRGFVASLFVSKLYKILGVDSMMLNVVDNNVYYDIDNHIQRMRYLKDGLSYSFKYKSEAYIKEKLSPSRNPHILIVNVKRDIEESFYRQVYSTRKQYKIDNIDKSIAELRNTVYYNGEEYVLDSIILSNWNSSKNIPGHAIAGITCNNEKYVYNGWTRYTVDAAMMKENMKEQDIQMQRIPCEFMQHDWDPHKDQEFCLNTQKCMLTKATRNDYHTKVCFSFGKGRRSLIYVKKKSLANLEHLNLPYTPDYRSFNQDISESVSRARVVPAVPIAHKECKEGQIRNPISKRCISLKTAEKKGLIKPSTVPKPKETKPKEPKPCKEGQIRNMATGRCISLKTAEKKRLIKSNTLPKAKTVKKPKEVKPCKDGQIRNKATGRCISLKSAVKKGLVKPTLYVQRKIQATNNKRGGDRKS